MLRLFHHLELFADGDRLARALTSPSISVGALAADRQTLPVPKATVGSQIHQALNIHADDTAKIAFHVEVLFHVITDTRDFIFGQLVSFLIGVDVNRFQNRIGTAAANPKNIGQTDFDTFVTGEIDPCNSSHVDLPLSLFVPRIRAIYTDDAAASKYATFIANLLNRSPNVHGIYPDNKATI